MTANWRAGVNTLPGLRVRCLQPRKLCGWVGRRVLPEPGDPSRTWSACPKCGGPVAPRKQNLPGQSKLARQEPIA